MFGGRRSRTCERSVVTNLDYGYWKNRLGTRLNSNLKGVEVEVFYIRRDGAAQRGGGAHMTFWLDYFENNEAINVSFYSID